MIRILKYKFKHIFKLKRLYILLAILLSVKGVCYYLLTLYGSYQYLFLGIGSLFTVGIWAYIFSLLLKEEETNNILTFLKIDKKKYRQYILTIILINYLVTAMTILVFILIGNGFNNLGYLILISLALSVLSPLSIGITILITKERSNGY